MNFWNKIISGIIALSTLSNPSIYKTAANKKETHVIFLHGIIDNKAQAQRYQAAIAPLPYQGINFPDACIPKKGALNKLIWSSSKLFNKSFNRNQSYLGQQKDIDYLCSQQLLQENKTPTILFGASRGASAAIKYMAQTNDANIQALVLDSGPNKLLRKVQAIKKQLKLPGKPAALMKLAFPHFDQTQPNTTWYIKNIRNKNLPVCILHSKTDSRVSYIDALELYQEFCKQGFTNVYLVLLPKGRHTYLLHDNIHSVEAKIYLQAIHSFYKAHGFAHNENYAVLPLHILKKWYKPSAHKIQHLFNLAKMQPQKRKQKRHFVYNTKSIELKN